MMKNVLALSALMLASGMVQADNVKFEADVPVVCGIAMNQTEGGILLRGQSTSDIDMVQFSVNTNDASSKVAIKYDLEDTKIDLVNGDQADIYLVNHEQSRYIYDGETHVYNKNEPVELYMFAYGYAAEIPAGELTNKATLEVSCSDASF